MQQRQLTTSTTHWAQELLMNIQGSGGSRNVAKGSDSLEEEEHGGWPSEFDNDQLRGSLKLILLQLLEKLLKSSSTILWSFGIWSRLERWKTSISGCLMNWLQIKKIHHFEMSSSLIICNNSKLFHGLWYAMKSGFYNWQQPAQWLDQEEAPKPFPRPNLYQKRSWSLVVCCCSDPLQLSESQRNHYIWEVCSANRWATLKTAMPAADTGQQKGPSSSAQQLPTASWTSNTSEVEEIGLRSFTLSAIFTWPLANWLPLQASGQLFAGKMLLQPTGLRKCFPRVHWIPKHRFLHYRNKQSYFSLAKICWL